MRRLIPYLLRTLPWPLLAYTISVCPAFSAAQITVIESINVQPTPEGAVLEIQSNQPFDFVSYTLTGPDRLIIDPVEAQVSSSLPKDNFVGNKLVQAWGLLGSGSGPTAQVDYISFELSQPSEHLVQSENGKLVVRVRPQGQDPEGEPSLIEETADPDFPSGTSEEYPVDPRADEPVDGGPEPWSVDSVVDFGLTRNRAVQIAQQEVELAELKLREARRALYPAATLRTSWTTGTASEIGFSEVSSGLQLEHPLYYSGRLMETYRQSLVNLQVAEKRKSKTKDDYSFEVAQAYLQLVGAQAGLSAQKDLAGTTEQFLQKTRERFEKGLLTRLELLNVEAQANQAGFQLATAENDMLLARLKLMQRLNLEPEAVVEVPDSFPPVEPIEIDLEEALNLSTQHRSDIKVNTLLVEFHEMEGRIAKAKGDLKVDLSGFIGASGSAFETETLDLAEDYFVGVKATRAWGPHGVTASTTTTKTSPRLGQTTRTDSTVYAGELGILNQLQGISETKQAHIGYEKARADLEDTKLTAYQEVQEAYISYQKARLQLKYAKQKVTFRDEQVKIIQAQASLNEALPSQVIEAMMKLTDERVGESQGVTNYQVALAKLNKAVGLPGYYQ